MENESKRQELNFTGFISGLALEGLASLGLIKHPAVETIKKDLGHASTVIDVLVMLEEKTKGNLTKEEADALGEAIHQLRMGYVAATKEGAPEKKEPEEKK